MADKTLADIVTVQLGLILDRKKADNDPLYAYKRLTLRAMESDGINLEAIEPFYSKEPLQEEYLTRAGTIVMKLFSPFNPVVITRETEGYLFPSQMVCIWPVKSVLPEYLCLYLSRDFVTKRLLANYFWIAQRAITVDSLLNLEVRVPSLKNQRIICDYYQNYRYIRRLREELDKEEQAMMRYIFSILSSDKEQQS
jgi:restriction endonuclease S subunit